MNSKTRNILLIIIGILVIVLGYLYIQSNKPEPIIGDTYIPITETEESDTTASQSQVLIFHNGTGPMCLDALEFFKKNDIEYTEYLNTEESFKTELKIHTDNFNNESEGVSTTFSYYPIIIVGDRAFSGFNSEIYNQILQLIK